MCLNLIISLIHISVKELCTSYPPVFLGFSAPQTHIFIASHADFSLQFVLGKSKIQSKSKSQQIK